jgi:hypothetical protein
LKRANNTNDRERVKLFEEIETEQRQNLHNVPPDDLPFPSNLFISQEDISVKLIF